MKNNLNPRYFLDNSTLTVKLNGFKNLKEFKVLLYLINNDNKNIQNGQNWAGKLVDIFQTVLKIVKAILRNLKYLYVTIGKDVNNKLLFLDPTELDKNIINKF